jgi:glyoxylase-like metal-dependent hydrolase (beta-lactamase superfamily II)
LRVPYIPAQLENWPKRYAGVRGLQLHVFVTGHVRASEALLQRGGSVRTMRTLPLPVFVLRHPRRGLVVINTGPAQTPASGSGLRTNLLGALLGTELLPGDSVSEQMQRAGLDPEKVGWIILTTMEAEHTGGLRAFPNARVVVSQAEETHARGEPVGYRIEDFEDMAQWEFVTFKDAPPLATFPAHVDLFADGSCLLIDAAGSTPGTLSLLVRLPQRPVLLADGLAPLPESVRYAARPTRAADLQQWWQGIWRLKRFKDLDPRLLVVPGRDASPLEGVDGVVVHAAPTPAATAVPTPSPGPWERLIPRPMR